MSHCTKRYRSEEISPMEDLKEAVAPVLGAQLDKDNILEISKMAIRSLLRRS